MIVFELFCTVFFGGNSDIASIIIGTLAFLGMALIFRKCRATPWHAFIPGLRKTELGRCAGREDEGRVLGLLDLLLIACGAGRLIISNETIIDILWVAFILLSVVELIYNIRVYSGLIEVFHRKKAWILLWAFPLRVIPALIWGFGKEYQPLWSADEIEQEDADYLASTKATVLDRGLAVDLKERTATELFRKKYLLKDIRMEIQPGHMVLLLGGSGAGKTTFLNAVNGYEKARAEVTLNNRNMYQEYKEMQHDIGFVPQQDLMRGADSVYRTLMDAAIMRLPKQFSRADREQRVKEVMSIFGLAPVKNNLVVKLSGGQRKRLSIAMEFLSNPSLFILDEPDSGLDGVMARALFQQLRQIADLGKIVIVITHTPDRVIDLFDDVIVLAKDTGRTGRLAYFGPIAEAREFFGREKMEEVVKSINRKEEGGEGRADEFIEKYAEVCHG